MHRPTTDKITMITSVNNWNGFKVDDNTELKVLKATTEGDVGDGKTTCTLVQKASNYEQVQQEVKHWRTYCWCCFVTPCC